MASDAEVQQIIQEALDHSFRNPNGSGIAHSLTERLCFALGYVIRKRNRGGHCDEAWSLADHYLHARYQVAIGTSVTSMMIQAYGYNAVKAILDGADGAVNFASRGLTGTNSNLITPSAPTRHVALSEGRCIISQPSLDSIRWASRGADDGMNDRRDLNINRRLLAPAHP